MTWVIFSYLQWQLRRPFLSWGPCVSPRVPVTILTLSTHSWSNWLTNSNLSIAGFILTARGASFLRWIQNVSANKCSYFKYSTKLLTLLVILWTAVDASTVSNVFMSKQIPVGCCGAYQFEKFFLSATPVVLAESLLKTAEFWTWRSSTLHISPLYQIPSASGLKLKWNLDNLQPPSRRVAIMINGTRNGYNNCRVGRCFCRLSFSFDSFRCHFNVSLKIFKQDRVSRTNLVTSTSAKNKIYDLPPGPEKWEKLEYFVVGKAFFPLTQ